MIIFDDFIKDENILRRINEPQTSDEENFWRGEFDLYKGWDGVGVGCFVHEFIKYIFTDERLKHLNEGTKYYEFWTNSLGPQNVTTAMGETWGMLPHFDKDEELLKYKNEYRHPKIGVVYYGCKSIGELIGGELSFWEDVDASFDIREETSPPPNARIVAPKFNKLILFDASKLHGVKEIEFGERRVIAVNLWDHEPFNGYDFTDDEEI